MRPPIPTMRQLTEAQAHPSMHADELLTPTPDHGYLRRTCINTWWLAAILFPFAVAPGFVWRTWWAWGIAAVVAAWWTFAQAAASPDLRRESDRTAFGYGLLMVGVLTVLVGAVVGGVVWVGGMR